MIISELEARVICQALTTSWCEGFQSNDVGDIALAHKILTYFPDLRDELTMLETREGK